jgi:hypothetical protein
MRYTGGTGRYRAKTRFPLEKKTEDVQNEKMIPIIPLFPCEKSAARLSLSGKSDQGGSYERNPINAQHA